MLELHSCTFNNRSNLTIKILRLLIQSPLTNNVY